MTGIIIFIVLAVIIAAIIISNIQIVSQSTAYVIERLGTYSSSLLTLASGYSFCPLLMPMSEVFSISFIL